VARGPLENHLRPAADPLFRSAAAAYGVDVIGVVLSGNLNDGTTGLDLIKKLGGTAIVQDPADALYPGMPANALQEVSGVDHVLPAAAIGQRILALVNESRVQSNTPALDVEPDIVIGRPDPHGHSIKE
ncbi:MAG TPA: chemotaxis protein CheB, partial [Longimicrobiales bacterium]